MNNVKKALLGVNVVAIAMLLIMILLKINITIQFNPISFNDVLCMIMLTINFILIFKIK